MTTKTDTEQERALLPCPFCGGEAHFDSDDDGWNWIECGSCRVATNHRTSAMDDCRPLLAEAWNRRVALQSQDRERIDWIDEVGGADITRFSSNEWKVAIGGLFWTGYTLRDAIDAAIDHARRIEGDGE